MPHDDNEDEPRHSREHAPVLREGTRFEIDIKFAILAVGGILAVASSWGEQKYALKAARYEIDAEITRVETAANRKQDDYDRKLENIEALVCALAKKSDIPTSGCR